MNATINTQTSVTSSIAETSRATKANDSKSPGIRYPALADTNTTTKVSLSSQLDQTSAQPSPQLYSPSAAEGNIGALTIENTPTNVAVLPPPDLAAFEADAALPRAKLFAKYEKAVSSLNFRTQAAADRANAEVPKSDDPARLVQAERATAYVHDKGASPFASLSRNELSAIYYDYSGRYTSNERLAANKQINEMDKQFWAPLVARYDATGDSRAVLEAGLDMYNEWLPIEKMKQPANYVELTHQEIAAANKKQKGPIDDKQRETLLEMLNALYKKQDPPNGPAEIPRPDQGSYSKMLAQLALANKRGSSVDDLASVCFCITRQQQRFM